MNKTYRGDITIDWLGYADDLGLFFQLFLSANGPESTEWNISKVQFENQCLKNKKYDHEL